MLNVKSSDTQEVERKRDRALLPVWMLSAGARFLPDDANAADEPDELDDDVKEPAKPDTKEPAEPAEVLDEDEAIIKSALDEADGKAKGKADAKPKDWDKSRQHVDQANARAAKAEATASQYQQQLQQAQSAQTKLEERLAALEGKAKGKGVDEAELDESEYEGTDLALVKAIKALKHGIAAKGGTIDKLEKKIADYEQAETSKARKAQQAQVYEDLLSDLDTEYGAQHRNSAIAAFNKLVKAGRVATGNPIKAARMMEKCYRTAAKYKGSRKSPALDTGTGGSVPSPLGTTRLKEGSLAQVSAQVQKAFRS